MYVYKKDKCLVYKQFVLYSKQCYHATLMQQVCAHKKWHLCRGHVSTNVTRDQPVISDASLDEEELSEGEDLGRAGLLVRVADRLVEGVGGVVPARRAHPLQEGN